MQGDGNLVVYAGQDALWATMTNIKAVRGDILTSNPGTVGQCTRWAEQQFHAWTGTFINTFPIPGSGHTGDAKDWAINAQAHHWAVGSTPRDGSIAVFREGYADTDPADGHVAWVTQVYPKDNEVMVSEMNYRGWNTVDTRLIPSAFGVSRQRLRYIYANP
jgi:surface antigen